MNMHFLFFRIHNLVNQSDRTSITYFAICLILQSPGFLIIILDQVLGSIALDKLNIVIAYLMAILGFSWCLIFVLVLQNTYDEVNICEYFII